MDITKVLRILVDYFDSQGYCVNNAAIGAVIDRCYNKYSYLDLDPFELATICINDTPNSVLSITEIRNLRKVFFPSKNYNRNLFI